MDNKEIKKEEKNKIMSFLQMIVVLVFVVLLIQIIMTPLETETESKEEPKVQAQVKDKEEEKIEKEEEYKRKLSVINDGMRKANDLNQEIFEIVSLSPMSVSTPEYREAVESTYGIVEEAKYQLGRVDVPKKYEDHYKAYSQAVETYLSSKEDYLEASESLNPNYIAEGTKKIEKATLLIIKSNKMLEALNK